MTQDTINKLVRPEIRALKAYHVPPAQDLIKLDAMENPWSWSDDMRRAWLETLYSVEINRYPDPAARDLQNALREAMAVPDTAGVVLGNGSDELIQMIIQTVAAPGRVVLSPEPTFVMYRQIAVVASMDHVGVPLAEDFTIDETAESSDESWETVGMLVSEVSALVVVVLRVGEVDGVRLAASTHGYVDPFAVDASTCDCVNPAGGGSLSLVASEGVSPVEVAVVEIPGRHRDRVAVAIEADRHGPPFGVDCGHRAQVAVEDTEACPVLETYDTVPRLEHPIANVQRGSVKMSCFGDDSACTPVELPDGGVAMSQEEYIGWTPDVLDVAVPVLHGLVDGVVGVGGNNDLAASVILRDGAADRPVTKLGEGCSFPFLVLSDVVGEFDGG